MKYTLQSIGLLTPSDGGPIDPDVIDKLTDHLLEELLKLKDAIDPDVTATLKTGEIAVSLVVEAKDHLQAFKSADVLLRTALHAAGIHTPNWERKAKKSTPQFDAKDWHLSDASRLVDA